MNKYIERLHNITFKSKVHFFYYALFFIAYGIYLYQNYREIVHFNDIPVYLFYIDLEKNFFTPHHRYIAVFTEYLPLIFCKLGLKFSLFAFGYVINGLFSTFLLYIIYGYVTKKWENGWIFVLATTIGYKYSFYYSVPEHFGYNLAIFITLIYYHLFDNKLSNRWYLTSIIVGIILAGSHLFALGVVYIGLSLYFVSEYSNDRRKSILIHSLIILAVVIVIKKMFPISSYEMGRLNLLKENLKYIFTLDNAAFRYVFFRDQVESLDFKVLIAAIIFLLGFKHKYLQGIIAIAIYYFTFYLNCLFSYTWQGTEYMEMYGRLVFFGLLSSFIILSHKSTINHFFYWLVCGLCFFAFLDKTSKVKLEFTNRYQSILNLTKEMKTDKLYIQNDSLIIKKIGFSWAFPHETLMVSTLEGHSKTVVISDPNRIAYKDARKSHFVGSLDNFSYEDLKNTYFNKLDTTEYQYRQY